MSAIIKKCDVYFDHVLAHTGQNYDYTLNEVFFRELGLRQPDYYLGVVGDNLGQTMGNVLAKSYELMQELKPDAMMSWGYQLLPERYFSQAPEDPSVPHGSGKPVFDENLPEEINRVLSISPAT
jgi:UDP-N-acetylglucosamine 2-epimerase (non-hydrolysing)